MAEVLGPDGTAVVVDMNEPERMKGLFVEIFGLLIGYNYPGAVYKGQEMAGPSPMPLGRDETLKIIVDIVGVEAIEKRFEGLKLAVERRKAAAGPNPS